MNFQRKSRRLANGASAIVLSMLLVAQEASAQDAVPSDEAADSGEAIVVTGSRIARQARLLGPFTHRARSLRRWHPHADRITFPPVAQWRFRHTSVK